MLQKYNVQNIKTHIVCHAFYQKSCHLCDDYMKHNSAREVIN